MSRFSAQLAIAFRLLPHDTLTSEGRANERHRRIALSALASALSKIISVATILISVPLTLHYLGAERFGIWMMISSLVAIFAFADFGVGNGLLNTIAAANGREDSASIRVSVSSGYVMLTGVAVCLLLLFGLAYPFVEWPLLFNVATPIARQEAGPAVAVFVVCFALGIPLGLVQRVQMALQRGFLASLWQCFSSILGLIGVVIAVRFEAGLPWLVLALYGAPLLAALLNSMLFFGRMKPEIAPSRSFASNESSRALLRIGGLFFVLQIVAALAYASDSFIIAHLIGASAVAQYSVPERMFSLIGVMLTMVLTPLWPAYSEAIARRDYGWVTRTLGRSVKLAVGLVAAMSVALVFLAPVLQRLWVGPVDNPPMMLLAGLALWKTIETGATAVAVFLNGANVLRLQLVVASATLVTVLALKFILVPVMGIAGVVWATAIGYIFCALIPYYIMMPKIVQKAIGI